MSQAPYVASIEYTTSTPLFSIAAIISVEFLFRPSGNWINTLFAFVFAISSGKSTIFCISKIPDKSLNECAFKPQRLFNFMGFNWLSSKAETRKSHISGKGTFAKKNIKKGEIVAVFGGHVFNFTTWDKLPEDVKYEDLQIGEDLIIGPKKKEEVGEGDYVNHSCEPNAGIRGQIFLVAMKGIKRDEEITFDYSMVLCGSEFKMRCRCGKKSCRKVITANDWKKQELQKRYRGYFSYFLQQKIDKTSRALP